MKFRSSPVLLLFCAFALVGAVFLWNTAPRLWGSVYRAGLPADQSQGAEGGGGMTDRFRVTNASFEDVSVAKGAVITIENTLPQALELAFTRESDNVEGRDRMHALLATSSSVALTFATSGVWKCESTIIRLCGTIHVLDTSVR